MRFLAPLRHILAFAMTFYCALVFGQQAGVLHKILTKKDGIELDQIKTLAFDNEGFLWLGGGILDNRSIILSDKMLSLQRFNGTSFHNVTIPERYKIKRVEQLLKREDGKLYVNAHTALLVFDPFTAKFSEIHTPHQLVSNIFSFEGVNYILSQNDRNITLNILNKDDNVKPLFTFSTHQNKYKIDPSTRIVPLKDYCLIGDDNFPIVAIAWDGTVLKRFPGELFSRERGEKKDKFWMDEVFKEEGVFYTFVFNNSTLHQIDEELIDIQPIPQVNLPNQNLKIYTDAHKNHIIASGSKDNFRLNTFDREKGLIEIYRGSIFDQSTPMTLTSMDLTKDLWIGTDKSELHYIKFPKKEITNYLPNIETRGIAHLYENTYLIGTENQGWYTLNLETQQTSRLTLREQGREITPNSSRNFFKIGDKVWSNSGGSIIEVDLKTNTLQSYRHHPVTSMVMPSDSTFIYSTHKYHLMEFNIHTKEHRFLAKTDSLMIYDLELRNHKDLVAATDKGLLVYNLHTNTTKFFNRPSELPDPYLLMADYHDHYGYLLGSRTGELVAFNPQEETFSRLYSDQRKAGIATVLFRDNIWWINTFNGMVAYDIKKGNVVRFSDKDGLSNNEANRYSALDTGDGFLVGTISGLNYFKPALLKPEENISHLQLLKVRSYNEQQKAVVEIMDKSKLSKMSMIELPAEYKELQIDFSLTHNTQGREHSFRYRTDSEPWINLKQQPSIRFPNLAAGNYLLEIEAINFSGEKLGDSMFLKIDSKDFFYKTWWFYMVVSLLISLLSLYFIRQLIEKRKMQEKFSEELLLSREVERTRIAKDLHDSVGQRLTLIKRKAQKEEQQEITTLTHAALEEIRSISRGLYPAVLTQLGLTESIENLILELDESTAIFFSSDIDTIDPYFTEEASLNLYRFIQEGVSNILKHANATAVSLRIKKMKGPKVSIAIQDNGKGFDISKIKKVNTLGLKTIAERVRILNGNLTIRTAIDKGTYVEAIIPVK